MEFAHFAAFAALLLQGATAQLLSCEDVGCPMDSPAFANCQLEDLNAIVIGVSQINSSLSPNPMTWTVAFGSGPDTDGPLTTKRKDFLFGQPPDLQLQTADSLEACAIIFDGVSSALEFGTIAGPGNEDLEDGTCADALTSECVAQWTAQVEVLVSQNNGTLNCSELGQALQGSPPASCENLDGSWGKITTQEIAGLESPPPLQLNGCNPTIGQDYGLSKVASFSATLSISVTKMRADFSYGITPIFTIFTPKSLGQADGNTGPRLTHPEVHLNCLKIKSGLNASTEIAESRAALSANPFGSQLLALVMAMTGVWLMFSML